MKIAHSASIRVFCSEEENEEVTNGLKWLVPLDFEKEKIRINRQMALGFGDRKIVILEVSLTKEKQVKAFLDSLIQRLP
ncbi:MAG: RNA-binding domain-containing protein, partial [Nanoarchaeota archaeon]